MTDNVDVRSDAQSGLSRRTLVAGAAWTVPVVVGLAALPAAAASTLLTKEAVTNAYAPNVGSYNPGQLQINSVQVKYDHNVWTGAGISYNDLPTTATFSWEVVLKNQSGDVIKTLVAKYTVSLALDGNAQKSSLTFTGISPGTYTVESRVTSIVYSPNPVSGVRFATLDNSSSSTVTVH